MAHNVYATRPGTHASNLTFNNLNCNKVTLNWTSGDGAARVIVAKEGSLPTYTPEDGSVYSGDPSFGGSIEYPSAGDGNFIVYNANGTNFVNVTNLLPGKTYYFVIYEHDNNGSSTQYLTSNAPSITVVTYDVRLDFTIRIIDSCQMTNSFEFTNTSTSTVPGITYKFDFVNGTSTTSPVTHTFAGSGFKNVVLSSVTALTGCPASVSRNVKVFPKKIAYIDYALFKDTQCLESNYYEIQSVGIPMPFPSGLTYRWWFGDNDSSTFPKMRKRYKSSGTFNVQLELTIMSYAKPTACKDTLSFPLTVLPSPVGSITLNDTFQCLKHNGFAFDNPDNTLTFYKWYFGDNDSSDQRSTKHVYSDTGHYKVMHVAFANTGCKGRDTVDVHVLPNLNSRFSGLDTFYCESKTADILLPEINGGTYFGYPVTGNNLIPDQVGSFTLNYVVKDQYCSDTSFARFRVAPTPDPDLGNDTAVCSALSYTLDARESGTYLWNTNETTQQITVGATGQYQVTVTQDKCSASDTTAITFSTAPLVNIGSDTILCKGGGILLNAAFPKSSYLWSTGSTDSSIYAFNPGKYTVTVTNPCGTVQDSMFLFYQNEYCDLFMANAFSPGNDLVNGVFMPRGRNITVQLFQIYNRWGELVFETNVNDVGWDGSYKGELVQEGLYIWKLFYTTLNGPYIKKSNAFGQVLLIR